MTDNMRIWNKVKQPPATVLKPIQAGRLKGKSDISPQWRYEIMTELFGPCGIGWKYEIKRLWSEPGHDALIFGFAEILLYIKDGETWSEPIPGIGGSMLVAKESAGPYSSDEAYKMAVTDALSVALKMLGVAADIYAGKWDGSKYNTEPEKKKAPKPAPKKETESEFDVLCKNNKPTPIAGAEKEEFTTYLREVRKASKANVVTYFDTLYKDFRTWTAEQGLA